MEYRVVTHIGLSIEEIFRNDLEVRLICQKDEIK